MGAYLSKPNTTKHSEHGGNCQLRYGATTMQGWRLNQEDAHNCIVDYDKNCALFAVYDGHGGADVAQYTAEHFPNFLKEMAEWKERRIGEALEIGFVSFDEKLTSQETMAELKELAGKNTQDEAPVALATEAGVELEGTDPEEHRGLLEDADTPLEQLLKQYGLSVSFEREKMLSTDGAVVGGGKKRQRKYMSPKLRPRRRAQVQVDEEKGEGSAGGGGADIAQFFLEEAQKKVDENSADQTASVSNEQTVMQNGEVLIKENRGEKRKSAEKSPSPVPEKEDTSDELIKRFKEDFGGDEKEQEKGENNVVQNGTGGEVKSDETTAEGDGLLEKNVAVAAGEEDKQESTEKQETPVKKKKKSAVAAAPTSDEYVEDEEEDDDEEFVPEHDEQEAANTSSEEDADNGANLGPAASSDDDSSTDDSETAIEMATAEEEDQFRLPVGDTPGEESGTTACVAVIASDTVYVANAGDSRCVLCRDGNAVDLSHDHKPEDAEEEERIRKAGGRISLDGRVNGGLNLSRALGDHFYKKNKSLSLKEQMISPLPDVRIENLDRAKDRFLVLACDGIWNSMTSQEVVDFVSERISKQRRLETIAEELCEKCLASDTVGDGTGCDNMTVVIISLKKSESAAAEKAQNSEGKETRKDGKKCVKPDDDCSSEKHSDERKNDASSPDERDEPNLTT